MVELCARAGLRPERVLEVGCGDGALLAALAERGLAPRLAGLELSAPAAEIARARGVPGLEWVETFDGARLPAEVGSFDLGVISHVLEHVPEPAALLRETARVCAAVAVEVPLERNRSAHRGSKRAGAAQIGHIQDLDRLAVHRLVADAGLEVAAELADPLTREVHAFFAEGRGARARAAAKAAVRRAVFVVAPRLAEGVFTVHYACMCAPSASSAAGRA